MITQMNRLENAARLAMADLRQPQAGSIPRPARQFSTARIVAIAAAVAALAVAFHALM